MAKPRPHILPTIVVAQFFCTSVWFAGNAIVTDLSVKTGLGAEITGYVLSAVQFGFITGTLCFAFLMIADRFSPSRVFLLSSCLAALCNMLLLLDPLSTFTLLAARFGAGFFLAGIYPVGMKIAADYYQAGLGKALGFLVGALVLGSAFPYFTAGFNFEDQSSTIIQLTSALTVIGGFAIWILVPNGPFRKPSKRLALTAGISLFKIPNFRQAAFGYFGHMWELYAFWAFIPLAIKTYNTVNNSIISVPFSASLIIAAGGISCILGGYLSLSYGSKKVALTALTISGIFCLCSPVLFAFNPWVFLLLYVFWGMAVTADSPQFSTMVAKNIPIELKGTGLTIVNCIGFAISIISIQGLTYLIDKMNPMYLFVVLALGPILGVMQLIKKTLTEQ